jgi:hypothetical protein
MQAIEDAEIEIAMRLPDETLRIHELDRAKGVDALPEPWKQIAQDVFQYSLHELNYELSYNQLCIAFFRVIEDTERLEVIS